MCFSFIGFYLIQRIKRLRTKNWQIFEIKKMPVNKFTGIFLISLSIRDEEIINLPCQHLNSLPPSVAVKLNGNGWWQRI